MTNPIQFFPHRLSTTIFVLPVILGLVVITFHLNPKPPEPYREIVLDLATQKQVCELHGTALLTDVIHTECIETIRLNRSNTFPNAYEECPPGCTGFEDKWAKVGYCSTCRRNQRWAQYQRDLKITWRNLFSKYLR